MFAALVFGLIAIIAAGAAAIAVLGAAVVCATLAALTALNCRWLVAAAVVVLVLVLRSVAPTRRGAACRSSK